MRRWPLGATENAEAKAAKSERTIAVFIVVGFYDVFIILLKQDLEWNTYSQNTDKVPMQISIIHINATIALLPQKNLSDGALLLSFLSFYE